MHSSFIQRALIALIVALWATVAHAQLGIAMGAGVQQYNRERELDLGRQQLELQQKMIDMEIASRRQQEAMYRQQYELQRQEAARESARKENSDKIIGYATQAVDQYGDIGRAVLQDIQAAYANQMLSAPAYTIKNEIDKRIEKKIMDQEIFAFLDRWPQYKSEPMRSRLHEEIDALKRDVASGKEEQIHNTTQWLEYVHRRLEKKLSAEKKQANKTKLSKKLVM